MPPVLDYTINSVTFSGLNITVASLDGDNSPTNTIFVRISVNGPPSDPGTGQWTGDMTVPLVLGSHFYSWNDLVGYDPHNDPVVPPTPGNETMLGIQDAMAGGAETSPTSYPGGLSYFPWPGTGGGGGGGGGGAACFTASSKLLTPAGYVEASTLRTGDILVTADGRQVPIKMYTTVIKADKESAPYLIPKNALGRNVPVADLRLSPWHAISLGKGLWQKPQTASEINPGSVIQYDIGKSVQYYHFEAPNYFTDNFICEGTVVESFTAKQLIGKERPYTWSTKYKAYTRNSGTKSSKASTGASP